MKTIASSSSYSPGPYGKHMKTIATIIPGGKIRLRGKGSGFAERDTGVESPDPLQINVSVPSWEVGKRFQDERGLPARQHGRCFKQRPCRAGR